MLSKKGHGSSVVRCYEVNCPTRHPDGFTIYKVTQQIIQVDALENNIQESVTWKRYNDFKKLYKAMFSLHKALHRREEFPDFVGAQLFNRFDQSVIEERRRSAQDLLNFVGQRHYLVASPPFKEFFKDAQDVATSVCAAGVLQPDKLRDASSDESTAHVAPDDNKFSKEDERKLPPLGLDDLDVFSSLKCDKNGSEILTSSHESLYDDQKCDEVGPLGGVWLHLHQDDTISSGDGNDDDDADTSEDTSSEVGVGQATGSFVLDKAELSAFDSLVDDKRMQNVSNFELLSSVDTACCQNECDDGALDVEDVEASVGLEPSLCSTADLMTSSMVIQSDLKPVTNMRPRTGSVIDSGRGDLTASPVRSSTSNVSLPRIPSLLRVGASLAKAKLLPWKTGNTGAGMSDGQTEYIFEAAGLISQAQEHELAGCYEAAFKKYKNGIGILLKGVQKDTNQERREAVRMKTEKYLLKAEELYNKHLSTSEVHSTPNRWGITADVCDTEVDAGVALLRAPQEELKNLKVIGIIHSVQLVVDTATEGTFVVKTLLKSCVEPVSSFTSIVPTHLPYVVGLVKFYETDSAIYLLLQHAAGGRLWSYVSSYLNQCSDVPQVACHLNGTEEKCDECASEQIADDLSRGLSTVTTESEKSVACNLGGGSCPLSRLSISEIDCSNPSLYRELEAEVDMASDPLSPNHDSSSIGFDNILKHTTTEMNHFSIGSFDSASASRQTSCSSEINTGVPDARDATTADGSSSPLTDRRHGMPRDATLTDVGSETRLTCLSEEEVSIYDMYKSSSNILPVHEQASNDEMPLSNAFETDKKSSNTTYALRTPPPSVTAAEVQNVKGDGSPVRRLTAVRLNSQDRSFESSGRKRLRTLSSTFGELDLAGGDDVASAGKVTIRHRNVRLPESCVRQWAAEMVTAISRLHACGIICRDLSPANILLGDRGHILLTYFSRWNTVEWTLSEHAVSSLYCAPEVTGVFPVTPSCDWWSLGALLYELITGQSLRSFHPAGIMSHTTIYIPNDLSCEAQSLLRELLRYNPSERLGAGLNGSEDLRSHPFFAGIQWTNLLG